MEKIRGQNAFSIPKLVYILAVAAILLRYMILPFYFTEPYYAPKWFLLIQFAVAAAGVVLGKMWKNKVFWLLGGYCVLILVRVLFEAPIPALMDSFAAQIFFHGVWVTGACFSVASILDRDQLKKFLRFLAAAWTILSVAHCVIALYAAWIGTDIWNFPRGAFWGLATIYGNGGPGFAELNAVGTGVDVRLNVIFYCTVSGAIISLSAMVALCAGICERRIPVKILYFLALIPFAFAMGLTDTRACHVSFAAGAGAAVGILIVRALTNRAQRVNPQKAGGKLRTLLRWAVSFCLAVGVMAVLVIGIGQTASLFNTVKARGGLIVTRALAEEYAAPETVVSARGYSGDLEYLLTGRIEIWDCVVRYVFSNPLTMLRGESILNPMAGPNAMGSISFTAGHPHNALLMVLLESGIPGCLLILIAFLIAAWRSFRLVNKTETPLWLAVLPAVALSICVGDAVECIAGFLGYPYPNCSILYLCIGMICFFGRKPRKEASIEMKPSP